MGVGCLLVGPLLGRRGLRLIRRGAGGHRRLTHSLALGGAAWWSAQTGLAAAALVLGALAWGQLLHLIGDGVTPADAPLLWPLASQPWGLPRPIAQYGEALVTLAALRLDARGVSPIGTNNNGMELVSERMLRS